MYLFLNKQLWTSNFNYNNHLGILTLSRSTSLKSRIPNQTSAILVFYDAKHQNMRTIIVGKLTRFLNYSPMYAVWMWMWFGTAFHANSCRKWNLCVIQSFKGNTTLQRQSSNHRQTHTHIHRRTHRHTDRCTSLWNIRAQTKRDSFVNFVRFGNILTLLLLGTLLSLVMHMSIDDVCVCVFSGSNKYCIHVYLCMQSS